MSLEEKSQRSPHPSNPRQPGRGQGIRCPRHIPHSSNAARRKDPPPPFSPNDGGRTQESSHEEKDCWGQRKVECAPWPGQIVSEAPTKRSRDPELGSDAQAAQRSPSSGSA